MDSNGRIYYGGDDGTIRVYDRTGQLLNDSFASGLGQSPPIGVGNGGQWGRDIYSVRRSSGELLRFGSDGNSTVIGRGFGHIVDIAFGPDGAMYLSDYGSNRVLRVALPTPVPELKPGDYPVTVQVSDGRGGVAVQNYIVCVLPAEGNRPPVIVSCPITNVLAGQPFSYDADALDADGDALNYTLVQNPAGMTIDRASGLIAWSPEREITVVSLSGDKDDLASHSADDGDFDQWCLSSLSWTNRFVVPPGYSVVAATLKLNTFGLDDAGPCDGLGAGACDDRIFLDGIEINGAFDQMSFPRDAAAVEFVLGSEFLAVLQDGQVRIDLDPIITANWDCIMIDYSELTVVLRLNDAHVIVRASDGRGGVDEQNFALSVSSATGATISGFVSLDANRDGIGGAGTNLVFNGDFSLGNTGFVTQLSYSPWGLGPASTYSVDHNPRALHSAWASMGDHSTSNGLMLIVNGSTAPRLVVWEQEIPVETDAAYDFSAWLASTHPQAPARLRFTINDEPLGEPIQLTSEIALWHRFFARWESGTNTTARIAIENDELAAGGNDFVVDDIQFGLLERLAADQFVYLDLNGDGFHQDCEPLTRTDSRGQFEFSNLVAGTYSLRILVNQQWRVSAPSGAVATVTVASGATVTGVDFTVVPVGTASSGSGLSFISSPPQTTPANEDYLYRALAQSPGGDLLTYDLVVRPEGMLVETNTGVVAWRPSLSQLGVHDVILRVQDGRGGVALQSWQITVTAPNSAPVITTFPPGPAVVVLPWRYFVRAQDAERQALSFTLGSNAPAGMTLTNLLVGTRSTASDTNSVTDGVESVPTLSQGASALLSWTPALSQLGTHRLEIIVRDSGGAEARQTFDLEVVLSAPNRAPQFTTVPRTQTRLATPYAYLAEATDRDGDPITFELVTGPTGMVLTNGSPSPQPSPPGEGVLLWTPSAAQLGSNFVHLRVTDGRDGTSDQLFAITVTSTLNNSAPLIVSLPPLHATAGQPYEYNLAASDPDDDPVTWRLVSGPVGISLDPGTGALRWNPTLDQLGTNAVIVEAQDSLFATDAQTWQIDVGCVNRPPQITSIPPTQAQTDDMYLYAVRAQDPDGDALTFSFANTNEIPAGMTISNLVAADVRRLTTNLVAGGDQSLVTSAATSGIGGALIRWTPTTNQAGAYLIRVRVSDERGGSDVQSYNLYVADQRANHPPIIVSTPPRGATIGRPFTYTLRATDSDGDTLTFQSLLPLPTGATFTPLLGGDAVLSWTPLAATSQEFILAARDPAGASAAQRFFVSVRANSPPAIVSTPRTNATANASYRYDVFATDPDGDALTFALTPPVPSGLNIDALGRISWTPSLAQTGSFPVAVTVFDGFGGSASQTYVLTVGADIEPPTVSLALVQGLVDVDSGQWAGDVGNTVAVAVNASDRLGVASRALYLDAAPIPLNGSFVGSIPVNRGGRFTLTGIATDFAGNTNAATRSILFLDPRVTNHVFVQIHTPTNAAVVTSPVDIVATITNDSDIVSYSWGYALASDINPNGVSITDPGFTVLGTSNLPPDVHIKSLTNIIVGRFDPTLLNNDTYVIVVAAKDANVTWTEPVVVNVQGNLKFGEFRLEFTDLAIPLAGLPIQVRRVYDSRNAQRIGDFGYGWSLGAQDAMIRESVPAGRSFRPQSRVYLTGPDGRRLGFTFAPVLRGRPSLLGAVFTPQFQADPGVYERLETADEVISFEGAGLIGGLLEGVAPYNPSTYFLTTRDGTRYEYDETRGLQTVTDLNTNRLVYTRDGIFHYQTGAGTPDQSITFQRDARGRIERIIDPNGKVLRYAYDNAGDLRFFSDQVTNVTRYAYSAARAHFLTNIVDPLGRSALGLEYDEAGRLKTVRDANGNPLSQDFNSDSNTGTFSDGNGNVTTVRFDERGNETLRMLPGVFTNTFAYDASNNLLASTNGRGFSTNYTYDARGNVTSITDSLSNVTTIAYNTLNKPETVVNALGQRLALAYNASGQLTQVVNNAGLKTAVARDAQGRVTSLTDATGTNTTVFDYSDGCACGRPGKVINPDGSFRLYEYNSQGLTNRVVNELGAETLFHHDDSGRLLWMRDPLTNYTQFFYNGPLLTNVVDALGRSTRYEYDALNRTNRIIDAEGGIIEFRYDNNGNRTHVIDAVTNVTTFVYDAANRLKMQIDPLGHTNFFAYDSAGNRTEAIDRNGQRRTFHFDALNRMTNELWWEGASVVRSIVFGFNELGVQTLAADPAARYDYSFDALNRLERVAQSAVSGQPDFSLAYTYTALGQVESVTDNWGVRVGSGYDNRNRLASRTWQGPGVDPARVDFQFDVAGNRTRTDRYADLAGTSRVGFTTNAYNLAGIVTNITHLGPASEVLARYDYNFDAAYQIRRWAIGNQVSDFDYDRTGQLTNALNTAQPNENFRFDANGNRVGAQSSGSYVVGRNNQILSDGTNNYAYDGEGNMTSRSDTVTGVLTTYQFDHRNRLVNVLDHNPSGVVTQTVAFVYDAMNRRLSKTVNGQATRFLYNQDDSWADFDATNSVIARYLHGARIDELLARQRASDGRGWYLTDHLGTVRDIANAVGAVVAHVNYTSFGVVSVSNSAAMDRFLFTGRELDNETGLYFHRSRYSSSVLGRFVNQDQIGFDAYDFNLYRYVNNAPLTGRDPFGTSVYFERVTLNSIIGAAIATFTATTIFVICFDANPYVSFAVGTAFTTTLPFFLTGLVGLVLLQAYAPIVAAIACATRKK